MDKSLTFYESMKYEEFIMGSGHTSSGLTSLCYSLFPNRVRTRLPILTSQFCFSHSLQSSQKNICRYIPQVEFFFFRFYYAWPFWKLINPFLYARGGDTKIVEIFSLKMFSFVVRHGFPTLSQQEGDTQKLRHEKSLENQVPSSIGII